MPNINVDVFSRTGVPQANVPVWFWKASRFPGGIPPAENGAAPSGVADSGPFYSGAAEGYEGAVVGTVPTFEPYIAQVVIGTSTGWKGPVMPSGTTFPQALPATSSGTPVFTVQPADPVAPFQAILGPSSLNHDATTYNDAFFFGFNAVVAGGLAGTSGQPLWYMGFENNFQDFGGDNHHGPEWYVRYWSPNQTSVQFLEPFYARGNTDAPTTTIAAGSNGQTLPQAVINVASTAGFPIPSGGTHGTAVIATTGGPDTVTYTGMTGTTLTGCTGGTHAMVTGQAVTGSAASMTIIHEIGTDGIGSWQVREGLGFSLLNASRAGISAFKNFTVSAPTAVFTVQSTPTGGATVLINAAQFNAAVQFQNVGATSYSLQTSGVNTLTVYDKNVRAQAIFTQGASSAAAVTEFASILQADGVFIAGSGSGTPTLGTTANLGTTIPTPTVTGNNVRGQVGFGTGTGPTAAGAAITVTVAGFSVTPQVVVSAQNFATAQLEVYVQAISSTQFQICLGLAPAAAQAAGTYQVAYVVVG